MKALANDPAVRYHTAREFANDLILFRTGGAGLLACAVAADLDTDATRRTSRRRPHGSRPPPTPKLAVPSRAPNPKPSAALPPRDEPSANRAGTGKQSLSAFSTFTRVVALLAVGCVALRLLVDLLVTSACADAPSNWSATSSPNSSPIPIRS